MTEKKRLKKKGVDKTLPQHKLIHSVRTIITWQMKDFVYSSDVLVRHVLTKVRGWLPFKLFWSHDALIFYFILIFFDIIENKTQTQRNENGILYQNKNTTSTIPFHSIFVPFFHAIILFPFSSFFWLRYTWLIITLLYFKYLLLLLLLNLLFAGISGNFHSKIIIDGWYHGWNKF